MPMRKTHRHHYNELGQRVKHIKPPTAYNIFMSTAMKQIKLSNPTMMQKDVMRVAAEQWRARSGKGYY